ncbi:flippase, partial [Escherichia coli]|nr:flippase [Escherichia coli]
IARVIITFITFAFISRQLGPADTGILSFSQSLVIMLLCVTNLGLDSILISEFSNDKPEHHNGKKNEDFIYSTVMIAKFSISFVCVIVCLLILLVANISFNNKLIFILSLISLVFQSNSTFYAYFQAKSKALLLAKFSFFAIIISTVFKVILLYFHANVYWFSFSFSFDVIVLFYLLLIGMRHQNKYISFSYFRRDVLFDLLKKSYPIILSSLLVVLYTRLDQVMILKMMGSESLGIFSVAVKISESYSFIPVAVVTAFFPLIINNNNNDDDIRTYFDLVFASAFFSALLVILFSWLFLEDIFGPAYAGSFSVLSITVFSTVFAVMGAASTNYLVVINLTYMRLIRAIAGLIVNFILNIILIPRIGIVGAAYASLFSQFFSGFLANGLNKRTWLCFKLQFLSVVTLGIPGIVSLLNKTMKEKKSESIN